MNVRRTLAVTMNIFKRLRHDPRTIYMIVMMPIIFIVLFGFTFAGEPSHVPTVVVNLDQGVKLDTTKYPFLTMLVGQLSQQGEGEVVYSFSTGVVDRLKGDDTLSVTESGDLFWARNQLDLGRVAAVLFIPPDYTIGRLLQLAESFGGEVIISQLRMLLRIDDAANLSRDTILYIDRTNTQVYGAVLKSINNAFLEEIRASTPMSEMTKFMDVVSVYGENAQFVDYFAPGIMVIATTMITIILTIISFVRERNMGTLARLFSSPMTAGELVAGYAVGFGIISSCQSLELLGVGILLFQIQIVGSILLALGLIIALAFGVLGLGILLSTLAKNEFQAVQFVPLVLIPAIVLSGVFWPVEAMPSFFRPISASIPMTYAVDGLRSVMVRGWDLEQVWPQFLYLMSFAFATLALAVIMMQRKARNCS